MEVVTAARATASHPNKAFSRRALVQVLKAVRQAVFPPERQKLTAIRYILSPFVTGQRLECVDENSVILLTFPSLIFPSFSQLCIQIIYLLVLMD